MYESNLTYYDAAEDTPSKTWLTTKESFRVMPKCYYTSVDFTVLRNVFCEFDIMLCEKRTSG